MADLISCLDYIDPAACTYQEWVNVGMALKQEGYTAADWDAWSRRDAARYHEGECAKKWETFQGAGAPVTGGTIVKLAQENGWKPYADEDAALDWDSEIGGHDTPVIIDKRWIEGLDVEVPDAWDPVRQITTYLETLFESTDVIGYVTEVWQNETGKYLPTKGVYSRTAGEIIQALQTCSGDVAAVIGDYNEQAGAWVRFNPLDGQGVRNDNVTEYRFALVESDTADLATQNAILRELELPIACLVYSGGKSLHAIVRVDAADYNEYRKRVDYLYDVCAKNGLEIDRQNRNPSRLSRLPGVVRGDKKQFLLATNIGKTSYTEWHDWIEAVNDDLPDPESVADVWDDLPQLSPPLIDGVLRQGHKLLLAGPSKAGKSFALIELCCAIAEGKPWLGFPCTQGKVLYVNLELDRASCLHRFKDVYTALGWNAAHLRNIDVWNLRGKSIPMDKLAPKLIRRAAKKDYIAIIIDPIYKVITGDENSADQMAHFCNQFDKVCNDLGCAVIYCHHHSKGAQGGKASMDRASGSGVFARDPDALLDLIELPLSDTARDTQIGKACCAVYANWIERFHRDNYRDIVSQDDAESPSRMRELAQKHLVPKSFSLCMDDVQKAEATVRKYTAWRMEGTLREYPKFPAVDMWFDYPVHRADSYGVLKDAQPTSNIAPWERAKAARKKGAEKKNKQRKEAFLNAVNACNFGDPPTLDQLAAYLSDENEKEVPKRTVRYWIDKYGYMIDKETRLIVAKDDGGGNDHGDCNAAET